MSGEGGGGRKEGGGEGDVEREDGVCMLYIRRIGEGAGQMKE